MLISHLKMRTSQIERLFPLTSGLRSSSVIRKEIGVADHLVVADPLSGRVNDVDESGVGDVESIRSRNGMKERTARVEASNPGNSTVQVVADIAGDLSSKACTYDLMK